MVFCCFAFGNVGHNADKAMGFPIRRASDNSAVAPEPESCAVRPNHPVLRGECVLIVCKLVEFCIR